MRDDAELLRRYVLSHDNEAFSEFVRRNIDFVYAIALRHCRGNAVRAQDVTQLVFTDVSRRAKLLVAHPALAGWLHTATRFAAMKILRAESRRQLHDQQAAEMQAMLTDETSSIDWTRLQPVLDDAIGELKERDRTAILLRFFQGKSLLEVGANLQLSETAARSCVDRALDRLRKRLTRHGVTSTCAALSLVLAQQVGIAAPAGLSTSISGIALVEGAVGGPALIPLFVMKKIIATAAIVALVAEFAAGTVEFATKRTLEANYYRTEPTETAPTSVAASSEPSSESSMVNLAVESARLEKRLAQLQARPPGVLDSQMKAPRAEGRGSALEAMQTMTAALRDRDLATLEHFVSFANDTRENREAFMANFSEAVRVRYPTPERLMLFSVFAEVLRDPPVAQQVLATHGYSGSGGMEVVTTWTRLASGLERKDYNPFIKTPEGWAFPPFPLTGKDVPDAALRARFDPATGEVLARDK